MMLKRILFSLVLVLVSTSAFAEQDAAHWINKMRTASTYESYRGVFMFSRGDMSSSMRVVHRFIDGQEQERLTQLDGDMGEILRRGTQVMCLIKGQRLVELDKPDFANPVSNRFANFIPGHMHYTLHKKGYERIVNRSSVKLKIMANDAKRYSYALWLDEDTGLLLKSQVLGAQDKPLELFQFSQLELPAETFDSDFEFDVDSSVVSHHKVPMSENDMRWPERLNWTANYHPPGFMEVESTKKAGSVVLYSDGLANYTVFVELKSKASLPNGATKVGATTMYIKPLEFNDSEYTVTVVGEIPPMTAMNIAEGVQPIME
ncbi:hypothetical protein A3715_13415 [Oleiphilus sp. HI0009]|nr:hypothetical protein A3715_13415 [Oleiphilus sp. HI0009]